MSAMSSRFARPLVVVLAIAAVPIVLSVVAPRRVDDCVNPARLLDPRLIDETSRPLPDEPWYEARSKDRVNGTIPPKSRRESFLEFSIMRGWGLPGRFLQPIPVGRLEPDRKEILWVESGGREIPIHKVSQQIESETRFAHYMFVYDGEPVLGAFTSRVRSAVHELLTGGRPITVLRIVGRAGSRLSLKPMETRAEEWLAAAWEHYEESCRLPGRVGGQTPPHGGDV